MKEESMTRKQALAVFDRIRKEYSRLQITYEFEQWKQNEETRNQINEAERILTQAVFGKPKLHELSSLCECCGNRYAVHFAHEKHKPTSTWCCSPCYEQLKAEQKLEEEVEP